MKFDPRERDRKATSCVGVSEMIYWMILNRPMRKTAEYPRFSMNFFMGKDARKPEWFPILSTVLTVFFSSCMGSQPRLSDIRQDFSSLTERVETYQQVQSEARERQKKALQKMQNYIEQESSDLAHRPPDVFSSKPVFPSSATDTLDVIPIEESPLAPSSITISPHQEDAEQLFRDSMEKYNQQQYNAAAEGFLLAYSYSRQPDLLARCLYWAGECNYHNREWARALECFMKVELGFPTEAVAPAAVLREGYTLLNSGRFSDGKRTLQRVIKNYPQSNEAVSAKERLRELGVPR